MNRRFVVAVKNPTAQGAVEQLLDDDGCGWLRVAKGTWLVHADREVSAAGLRDVVAKFNPTSDVVVLEVTAKTWSAAASDSAVEWLREEW